MDQVVLAPIDDERNRILVSNVHPDNWINPVPADRYNLVVIGAGTAGLVSAAGAAALGARVALVEKYLMGGDCLNTGCVPSKSILRSARALAEARQISQFGIRLSQPPQVDFATVMQRMRAIRARISGHDSAERFTKLGVDIFFGEAHFTGRNTIAVNGTTLNFRKAVIATGARPIHPQIEGLRESGYLTNETVFSLTKCPERLAVIGAGPLGCELAQAFCRLGSEVFLYHKNSHVLDREDPDAAEILQNRLIQDGVHLFLNSSVKKIRIVENKKEITFLSNENEERVEVNEILTGTGRIPNVEKLNLEIVGVEFDKKKGIRVNDRLQTTNPRIFAAGDVCMEWKFTHAAEAAARIVLQNSLFPGRKKISSLTIPWCTYTDPEIAHVGIYEHQAHEKGLEIDTFQESLTNVDRAITDSEDLGFCKIHTKKGTDKIVGATIVASHAGEMISELTLAIAGGIGLKGISSVVHPYPTQAEAIRHAADGYNKSRLKPFVKKLLSAWMSWTR